MKYSEKPVACGYCGQATIRPHVAHEGAHRYTASEWAARNG